MKTCSTCGAVNEERANFCQKCGGKLATAAVEPAEPEGARVAETTPPRFTPLRANLKIAEENACAVCGVRFKVGEDILQCESCRKYYHPACKEKAGGCTSPECREEELKSCPYCAEKIKKSAVKCRFCGQFIDRSATGLPYRAPGALGRVPAYSASNYKLGKIGTYGLLIGIGILLIVMGVGVGIESDGAGAPMLVIGVLLIVAAQIYLFVLLYQIWRYVIGESVRYGLAPDIDSPGKAVGYLFIPFYNLYWAFVAFGKFARNCNAVAQAKGSPLAMSEGTGQAIPVLILLNGILGSFIPYVSLILTPVVFIVEVVFFSSAIGQCRALRDMP